MPILRTVSGGHAQDFLLQGKQMVIGRDPSCDIVVHSKQVSRRHAMILDAEGVIYVEDLGSVNGTYVNGTQISQRTRLAANDRIDICHLSITVQDDEGPQAPDVWQTRLGTDSALATQKSAIVRSRLDMDARVEIESGAKLRAILIISRSLGHSLDLDEVLAKILESLFTIFPQAHGGIVYLADPRRGHLFPRARRLRREGHPVDQWIDRATTFVNDAMTNGRAVLGDCFADADDSRPGEEQPRLPGTAEAGRSVMCVPLHSEAERALGVIQLATDGQLCFRQQDLDILVSVSTQATRGIELALLHEERRDWEAATRIQQGFLPNAPPQTPTLEFFDYYASARHIGGDYYDYVALPGDRLAIALGDVAGKGVSAALLMARLSSAVRFCLATEPTVPAAIDKVNALLASAGEEDRFITFVVIVIDLASHQMTVVNAGHLPPLRIGAGSDAVEELAEEIIGLPLGVLSKPYEQTTVSLQAGDLVVLYTDGITEARNPQGELFGLERLCTVAAGHADAPQAGRAILKQVEEFAVDRPQGDDMTLVCFRRLP